MPQEFAGVAGARQPQLIHTRCEGWVRPLPNPLAAAAPLVPPLAEPACCPPPRLLCRHQSCCRPRWRSRGCRWARPPAASLHPCQSTCEPLPAAAPAPTAAYCTRGMEMGRQWQRSAVGVEWGGRAGSQEPACKPPLPTSASMLTRLDAPSAWRTQGRTDPMDQPSVSRQHRASRPQAGCVPRCSCTGSAPRSPAAAAAA